MRRWKAEEGDRVQIRGDKADSFPIWGSVIATVDNPTASFPYRVRFDDAPDQTRWICEDEILRLHRGAGPSPSEGEKK